MVTSSIPFDLTAVLLEAFFRSFALFPSNLAPPDPPCSLTIYLGVAPCPHVTLTLRVGDLCAPGCSAIGLLCIVTNLGSRKALSPHFCLFLGSLTLTLNRMQGPHYGISHRESVKVLSGSLSGKHHLLRSASLPFWESFLAPSSSMPRSPGTSGPRGPGRGATQTPGTPPFPPPLYLSRVP